MKLVQNIQLDDNAFDTASAEMLALKKRADNLKLELEKMYDDLTTALDTPAGKKIQITAKDVLIEPIKDLILVIQHISETLTTIIGTGYYKDVFVSFEQLNQSLNF